jgi:hypothetical protein
MLGLTLAKLELAMRCIVSHNVLSAESCVSSALFCGFDPSYYVSGVPDALVERELGTVHAALRRAVDAAGDECAFAAAILDAAVAIVDAAAVLRGGSAPTIFVAVRADIAMQYIDFAALQPL